MLVRKISSFRIRRGDWCVRACETLWRRRVTFLVVACAVTALGALIGPALDRPERTTGLWIAGIGLGLFALAWLAWNLRLTVDHREVGGVFLAEHRFFLLPYRCAKMPVGRARLGWCRMWEKVLVDDGHAEPSKATGCALGLVPGLGVLMHVLYYCLVRKKKRTLQPTEVLVLRDREGGAHQRILGKFKDASHRERVLKSLEDLEPGLVDLRMGLDIYPEGRRPDEKGEA